MTGWTSCDVGSDRHSRTHARRYAIAAAIMERVRNLARTITAPRTRNGRTRTGPVTPSLTAAPRTKSAHTARPSRAMHGCAARSRTFMAPLQRTAHRGRHRACEPVRELVLDPDLPHAH